MYAYLQCVTVCSSNGKDRFEAVKCVGDGLKWYDRMGTRWKG